MNKEPINITSVEKAGPYTLRLVFDDGTVQVVDFKPFLTRSRHPDIRAYLTESRFDAYHLDHGELVWGDYEMCFPILDLYLNRLEEHSTLEAAA